MKKFDLERLVTSVKTPPLDRRQTRLLVDDIVQPQEVVQAKPHIVAQPKPQKVAQSVAQSVAQDTWVAQKRSQSVAQTKPQQVAQSVAQKRPQQVVQVGHTQSLVAANEVEAIKVKIAEMPGIEERKIYLKSIGINIKVERRSKGYYFYGIKKIDGKKERFYCGRVC